MTQGAGSEGGRVYNGIVDCAKQVYREGGAKAFLRGAEARVLWIAIGGYIFFGTLDFCKRTLVPEGAHKHKVEQSVH